MGPRQRYTWTANHFVPILKQSANPDPMPHFEMFQLSKTSTPIDTKKRKVSFLISDTMDNEFEVPEEKLSKRYETAELSNFDRGYIESSVNVDLMEISRKIVHCNESNLDTDLHSDTDVNHSDINMESCESYDNDNDESTIVLPVPDNVKSLANKWHSATDAYKLFVQRDFVHDDVPPGHKSNWFLLVDNSQNIEMIESKKKCHFYDDCGVWDCSKGNTVKSTFVIENKYDLKSVEYKNQKYCVKET